MFITKEELKSAIYSYQIDEITEGDDDIVTMAISAAIEEMKSYLAPGNQSQYRDGRKRYDIVAIFTAEGTARSALVMELCKSMAVYYACRLGNVDILQEDITKKYDRAIDWLEKVSATGKYSDKQPLNADLPVVAAVDIEDDSSLAFRSGSREKFNHE
jgi:phage gp36-like protein